MNEDISLSEAELEMLLNKAIELAKETGRYVDQEMEALVKIYLGYIKGSRPWLLAAASKVFPDLPPGPE